MSVYIIAEAGVNHNGNIDIAYKMIDEAKYSGADCIKFQTFIADKIVSRNADKADYQKKITGVNETQLEMLRKLELAYDEFTALNDYCMMKKIEFLSTAFDLQSIDFLNSLNMKTWKIPSGEITNLPYLIKIAKLKKPIIMSTGMCTVEDIRSAVSVLMNNGSGEITLLHCTTEYPAPYNEVNLRALDTLRNEFKMPIGYSDHTNGIEISIAAVAMGATVIEKHFTLDKSMEGPDHKASINPSELKAMVNAIRNVEEAIGNAEKKPTESEKKNIIIARKSITAKRAIQKGEKLSEENLTVKRPGNGITPMKWFDVIDKVAPRNFEEDELIEL